MEVDKIDHVAVHKAIDEVSDDAATEQAEADLYRHQAQSEGTSPKENGSEGAQCEQGEDRALSGKEAPGRACVADMHEVKKSWDDRDVMWWAVGSGLKRDDDQEFSDLIEDKDGKREPEEPAVRKNTFKPRRWLGAV